MSDNYNIRDFRNAGAEPDARDAEKKIALFILV